MDDDKKVRRDDSRREEEVWRASECCCCLCWICLVASSVDDVVDVVVAEAVHSTNVDKGAYKASLESVVILPLPLSPPLLLVLPMLLIVHTNIPVWFWWGVGLFDDDVHGVEGCRVASNLKSYILPAKNLRRI